MKQNKWLVSFLLVCLMLAGCGVDTVIAPDRVEKDGILLVDESTFGEIKDESKRQAAENDLAFARKECESKLPDREITQVMRLKVGPELTDNPFSYYFCSSKKDGLQSPMIEAMFVDNEGSIWVGEELVGIADSVESETGHTYKEIGILWDGEMFLPIIQENLTTGEYIIHRYEEKVLINKDEVKRSGLVRILDAVLAIEEGSKTDQAVEEPVIFPTVTIVPTEETKPDVKETVPLAKKRIRIEQVMPIEEVVRRMDEFRQMSPEQIKDFMKRNGYYGSVDGLNEPLELVFKMKDTNQVEFDPGNGSFLLRYNQYLQGSVTVTVQGVGMGVIIKERVDRTELYTNRTDVYIISGCTLPSGKTMFFPILPSVTNNPNSEIKEDYSRFEKNVQIGFNNPAYGNIDRMVGGDYRMHLDKFLDGEYERILGHAFGVKITDFSATKNGINYLRTVAGKGDSKNIAEHILVGNHYFVSTIEVMYRAYNSGNMDEYLRLETELIKTYDRLVDKILSIEPMSEEDQLAYIVIDMGNVNDLVDPLID